MKKRQLLVILPTLGACLLALGVFVFIWGGGKETESTPAWRSRERFNLLFVGVDEAGQNTDMLLLCSLESRTGAVKILQIPRDTYYRTQNGKGKINRLYRICSSKYTRKEAAEAFCGMMEEALGVPIDAYLIFSEALARDFVDLLDGVTVDVPLPITYTDGTTGEEKTLSVGERRLTGEEALAFVRHRSSYAEGDLGRLDAQMRFMCGIYREIPRLKKIDRIIAIYQKILPNLLTNLREKDIIEIMMASPKLGDPAALRVLRLPGEATYTGGAWYYVLQKAAAEKMLADEFGLKEPFDRHARFTDPANEALRNVYTSPGTAYRSYGFEDAARKRVLRK